MPDPTARVVLLGASNVTRGAAGLIETARRALRGPVEFLIARGHGRSYGAPSRVLWRGLPGILDCGLWEALDGGRRRGLPTYALLTDVGNDVMYGAPVEVIAEWVRTCLERLAAHDARTVMSLLPMTSLTRLKPWRFNAVRRLLFPGRPMALADALDTARRLDGRLRALGESLGVSMVEPSGRWYGLDPIHPHRWHMGAVWQTMVAPWTAGPVARPGPDPLLWLRLMGLTSQHWTLAGHPRGRPQPALRLPDGTTLSFY